MYQSFANCRPFEAQHAGHVKDKVSRGCKGENDETLVMVCLQLIVALLAFMMRHCCAGISAVLHLLARP